MKVRKIVFITVVCLSFAILTANADTTTDLLFNDSDTLSPGYYVRYQDSISHSSTTVRVEIDANGPLDFGICNADEMEEWNDGGPEPTWYVYRQDVSVSTINVVLNSRSYDFVLMNFGSFTVSYDIDVYETYELSPTTGSPTGDIGDYVYGLIGFGIILAIGIGVFAVIRSRRRRQQAPYQPPPEPYQPYSQQSYQQPSQYPPSYSQFQGPSQTEPSSQPITDSSPKGLQVCLNCGNNEDANTKFCTNCGSKLE